MNFTPKHFNPLKAGGERIGENGSVLYRAGENPDDAYLYNARTILAVNVALATRRPLLISGEPGSGKSTLARNAAAVLGWWYYKHMITSRTQAPDLLWIFDVLRRLNDAHDRKQELPEKQYYVEPGALWWAFSPKSARERGTEPLQKVPEKHRAHDPGTPPPLQREEKAVLLLDEIDKADPDVPNDLLEPFDLKTFTVRETGHPVTAEREVLLILTTNGERELPPAFLRRCITLTLDPPKTKWFIQIANQRFGLENNALHRRVAKAVMALRKSADEKGIRAPSTAEYIDALEACGDLGIDTDSDAWSQLARSVLWKHESVIDISETGGDEG